MTLSLQKATQKPSWGSFDETDSAITTTELTEKIKQLKARAIRDVELSCRAMMGQAAFKACRLSFFILTTGGLRLM